MHVGVTALTVTAECMAHTYSLLCIAIAFENLCMHV
jgi:hypothetical protein